MDGYYYYYTSNKTGYTFLGYYTQPSDGTQCTSNQPKFTNCDITGATTWYAGYKSNCIKIALESRSTTNNAVASGKLIDDINNTIYYNNGLFLDSSCSTSLTDAYQFVTSNNVDSYAGVYSADSTSFPLCIDGSAGAEYQDDDACKPTEDTTWYVYFDDKPNK